MQFWGVEVKDGIPLEVEPEDGMIVHISQGSLGEGKDKGTEPACIYVNTGGQKVAIGTLSRNIPQISYDLYLEKKFELSHTWKGSVYFCGYKFALEHEDSDSEEDLPLPAPENVRPLKQEKPLAQSAKTEKSDSGAPKPKVQIVEPVKDVKFHGSDVVSASSEDDSSDDDDDSSDEDEPKVQVVEPIKDVKFHGSDVVSASSEDDSSDVDDSSDEDEMQVVNHKADEDDKDEDEDDSEDDESDEDESDDQTEKAAPSKKRANDSATKTPVPEKKAKFSTPKKTDVKKGSGPSGHVATPHPSKQTGKTPANNDKSKEQTSKAVKSGEFSCGSCNRSFGSDMALQSHTKAKHAVS